MSLGMVFESLSQDSWEPLTCANSARLRVRNETPGSSLKVRSDATPGCLVKEYPILGSDKRDAETQRDFWLSRNPSIRVIKIHGVTRETQTLLTRIGVSMFSAFR